MKTEQLLFFLLREELGEIKPTEEEVKSAKKDFWLDQKNEIFDLAKKHDLAHVVGSGLANLGLLTPADSNYKFFEKECLLAVYRYENQRHEYEKIKNLFIREKIDFIPLKGLIASEYYNQPTIRTSCDLDILIKKECLKKAQNLFMEELGYKLTNSINYHDIVFTSGSKVKIELHFSLTEGVPDMDSVLETVWDYAASVNGTSEYRLTNEFFLFHIISHSAYHFLCGGCGIKPIMDLFVLGKKLNVNQDELNDLLEKAKLNKFYGVALALKDAWFNGEEHNETTSMIARFILSGGAYGSRENEIIIQNVKAGSKLKYFFSRMFLPYQKLKLVYPVLNKHKWLFPFCQIARWFSFLFGVKNQNGVNEIAVLTSAKKDDINKAKTLLEEVGL